MKNLRKLLPVFATLFVLSLVLYVWKFPIKDIPSSRVTNPVKEITPTSKGPQSPIAFAVISDIHSDYDALQKTLDRIRADNIQFIIIAGDLTTVGGREELKQVKKILDDRKITYYAVPGNHDLWAGIGGSDIFREIFGSDYQSFRIDKVKFILINNGNGIIGVGKNQRVWLEKELANCPKLYCLVFAHMPLNNPVVSHVMGENSPIVASQSAGLIKEMVKFQVKELFAGHVHYLSSYGLDGLQTSTDGVIYTNNKTQNSRFLEIKIILPEYNLSKTEIWINN